MSRFEEATSEPYEIVTELVGQNFPSLSGATFEIIFDTKKKTVGGRMVFARIQSTNDLLKYMSSNNNNPNGVDYIIYIDKALWDVIDRKDKERLIFHELNHCDVDLDKKKPFGIKDHDILMFESEISYNADDPKWTMRLSEVLNSIYNEEE